MSIIKLIFHKCIIMFLDEQFTYEHSEAETSKQIKEQVQASTPLTPKDAKVIKIEINKQEKEKQTVKETETIISTMQSQSPKQIQQSLQNQQKQHLHQSEHRASIASAPAATIRSSSISTITGVC